MAAWALPREIIRTVVAGTKRSPAYRRLRPQLATPCPTDVWIEEDLGFVQFRLDGHHREGGLPGWVVFAVRLNDGGLVAAKILEPGPGELQLTVSDLLAPAL